MLRLYAGERVTALQCKVVYRGYDLEVRRAASGWRVGFILAQPICLSLSAARSLPATKTRPWWWLR